MPFSSGLGVASKLDGVRLLFSWRFDATTTARTRCTVGSTVARLAAKAFFCRQESASVDVDDMALLGEAIDEGDDARSAGEHAAPLLEGQIGRPRVLLLGEAGGALATASTVDHWPAGRPTLQANGSRTWPAGRPTL